MPNQDEKFLAMLIYLISFFTVFIGPLIIWLIKKDSSKFIDYHGREYLNFLISYTIYTFVASLTFLILIGFVLVPVVAIAAFIFTIIGAVKAYEGTEYKIPFIFRLL
ncbi:DUF4870 domain-containing protein [Peribacillus loiseleuriae]|uniref:DUF4870 domain-containing protein n=1 Tax=Peribacillus loiseleuriae TaxID=1679170 RepID=UPI003CFDB663